ncbi:hypothetical protein QFZ64_004677 [Streptomyces sp. B3I8]|nr:hypothetical protein [Streptomyces sp. B3I8]
MPAGIFSRVDFPAPFSPTTAASSPVRRRDRHRAGRTAFRRTCARHGPEVRARTLFRRAYEVSWDCPTASSGSGGRRGEPTRVHAEHLDPPAGHAVGGRRIAAEGVREPVAEREDGEVIGEQKGRTHVRVPPRAWRPRPPRARPAPPGSARTTAGEASARPRSRPAATGADTRAGRPAGQMPPEHLTQEPRGRGIDEPGHRPPRPALPASPRTHRGRTGRPPAATRPWTRSDARRAPRTPAASAICRTVTPFGPPHGEQPQCLVPDDGPSGPVPLDDRTYVQQPEQPFSATSRVSG